MKITLATLSTATAQQVFEQAAMHLLKQNDRSMDRFGSGCAYRGRDGLACAAGALMSDADALRLTAQQNAMTWGGLVELGIAPETHGGLIRSLQRIHDQWYPADWRAQLRKLADHSRLDSSFMNLLPVPYAPVSSHETVFA